MNDDKRLSGLTMNPTIVINPFVERQTADSEFSHYDGPMEDVLALTKAAFHYQKPGYRDGVIIITVPKWIPPFKNFYTGVVSLTEGMEITGSFASRRDGEAPRIQIRAKEHVDKLPAKQVDIVLYRSDVLAEDGDNTLPPDKNNWEIVSINASPDEGDIPINPNTLMHNHFGSDGGTDTQMSDTEFVNTLRKAFTFWNDKTMASR